VYGCLITTVYALSITAYQGRCKR